jgi:dimethylsulfide dehydrogenase subunit beta/complex iron-sulfur molybdoenzyme family reductase subunit beta
MSNRQLAMVMDLNKCIGCQTCTSACKTQWTNRNGREYMYWNNVETKPGAGYPRDYEASGGGFDENGQLKMGKFYPNSYHFYLPRICNHCTNPACLAACSRNAIYKRQEDGIVLIDQERCRGYRYCVTACPYKKVYFNEKVSKSEKCIFCYPRIEKGLPTACAQQCVGRIRWIGYRDDRDGPIYTLVDKYKVALPLHAEWGTDPNVFYVPPTAPDAFLADGSPAEEDRIPLSYLESLFGDGVRAALDTLEVERNKKRAGEGSKLMDTLIAYKHSDMFKLA